MKKEQIIMFLKRTFVLLLLAITVNSCKKDLLAPKKISKMSKEIGTVENIDYSTFLRSVNLERTGPLRAVLIAKSNTETSTKTSSNPGEFELDMVNVKKLTLKDGISYVIGVKPQTKRAIQFQNVTVQEKNGKTTAFLTTYVPTKKWIEEWKKGVQTDTLFRGEIYSQSISLVNLPNSNVTLGTQSTKTIGKTAITVNGKVLNLAPGECEFYDIYQTVYIPCKEGHLTRAECNFFSVYGTWDEQPNDWPPYTNLVFAGNVVYCEPGNSGGGGSGGGSGSTTPNPPGGYDPCDCNPPPPNGNQSIKTNSTENKLLIIPANCCDDPVRIILPTQVQSLVNILNLYGPDLAYVAVNQNFAIELYSLLEEEGFSAEAKSAALMTIKAEAAGISLSSLGYQEHYQAISSALPSQPNDVSSFITYLSIQCIIIKAQHPEYPNWKVYWEASQEALHLVLDGIGLVPGIGEVADIINGSIYTLQGDGVNAGLSFASAIPIAGWFSTGAKFAKKGILTFVVKSDNIISFGRSSQLRKVLGLTDASKQAHHIIPWALGTHPAVQKAAKSADAFHLNEALNGIPLELARHQGSHPHYSNLIQARLDNIPSNATPTEAYNEVLDIINDIRAAIRNNPGVHINQLIF